MADDQNNPTDQTQSIQSAAGPTDTGNAISAQLAAQNQAAANSNASSVDEAQSDTTNTTPQLVTAGQPERLDSPAAGAGGGAEATISKSGLLAKLEADAQACEEEVKAIFSRVGIYAHEAEAFAKYVEARILHIVFTVLTEPSGNKIS